MFTNVSEVHHLVKPF